MITLIEQLHARLDEVNQVKIELDSAIKTLRDICKKLKLSDFEDLTYDELKDIHKRIYISYISSELSEQLKILLKNKKSEIYPDMKKPQYFKEINNLNITDKEKLEVDEFLRMHTRHYMDEHMMKNNCETLLKVKDELCELGVLEKSYNFRCDNCYHSIKTLKQHEVDMYFRCWEIENKKDKTKEDLDELESLYVEYGMSVISLECYECTDCSDYEAVEITNKDEFEQYENINIYYKLIKNPDLTLESL